MKGKRVSLEEALDLIRDDSVVVCSGAMLTGVPREIYLGIAGRFKETGHPRNLTVMHAAGNGNLNDQGIVEISEEGLITKYICGHFCNNKKIIDLINRNKIEAYNLPMGIITHMYRAAANGKKGELTKIGLHTYCDPREDGGKMNAVTTEDIVELVELNGEELLYYKTPKFDIGLIRGTTADEYGNLTMDEETSSVDVRDIAMAVKSMGGKVIAQVKNYVSFQSVDRASVVVPGTLVDAVVVCENPVENHRQTPISFYDPVLAGHCKAAEGDFVRMTLDERKIIARRAAMELPPSAVVNLGIGMPEGVGSVAKEEGLGDDIILTVEVGITGGTPTGGLNFGAAINSWAELSESAQFDYYHGGNLDLTCLGFAEVDGKGNVNVTRFGPRIAGCGGFIDISQSTKNVVFCGTMTAGGLRVEVKDGKLVILQEGKVTKFKNSIDQISFSSRFSSEFDQNVLFVTERCVFRLEEQKLVLTEIAPGIDIEKDIFPYMGVRPEIADDLKTMEPRIFRNELMDLKSIIGGK